MENNHASARILYRVVLIDLEVTVHPGYGADWRQYRATNFFIQEISIDVQTASVMVTIPLSQDWLLCPQNVT